MTPFVVLDEVDAALDGQPLRYAAILEKAVEKTLFITITHNRAPWKRQTFYGVTMGDDGTSNCSIKMET